jgi:hypothetical protein
MATGAVSGAAEGHLIVAFGGRRGLASADRRARETNMRMPLLAAIAICLAPLAAHADAIDGAWCREGERLSIDGPAIVTPSGARLQGTYARHAFAYDDPASGALIEMRLLSEYEMESRAGPGGAILQWRRCGPATS